MYDLKSIALAALANGNTWKTFLHIVIVWQKKVYTIAVDNH